MGWWRRRRLRREAWRRLRSLFDSPERLEGTSLRAAHRGRVDLHDYAVDESGTRVVSLRFTILRHPRPYAFSRQHHEVIQLYRYDCEGGGVEHVESLNLSRMKGRDGEPSGGWGG